MVLGAAACAHRFVRFHDTRRDHSAPLFDATAALHPP